MHLGIKGGHSSKLPLVQVFNDQFIWDRNENSRAFFSLIGKHIKRCPTPLPNIVLQRRKNFLKRFMITSFLQDHWPCLLSEVALTCDHC